MAKISLTDMTSGYQSTAVYNANNTLLEAAIENTLSRDGTTPNTMSANLDMNSNRVSNLADGTNLQDAVTLTQLNAAGVVVSTIAGTGVTIADAGGYYTGTTAEGCLQELGATTGAAVIGIADSGAYFTATDVEGALQEIGANYLSATGNETLTLSGTDPYLQWDETDGGTDEETLLVQVSSGLTGPGPWLITS
jgi:hypothetical protein